MSPLPLAGVVDRRRATLSVRDMRDQETIDSEPRLVAVLRRAARVRGGPLPSIGVADARLDERSELPEWYVPATGIFAIYSYCSEG